MFDPSTASITRLISLYETPLFPPILLFVLFISEPSTENLFQTQKTQKHRKLSSFRNTTGVDCREVCLRSLLWSCFRDILLVQCPLPDFPELGNNLAKHRAVLHPGPRHQIAVASQKSRQTTKQIHASIISNTAYTVHVMTEIRPLPSKTHRSFRIASCHNLNLPGLNKSFCRRRQRYRSGPCTRRNAHLNSSLGRLNA